MKFQNSNLPGRLNLISTLIWSVIFLVGMHPDATWGDGLGYAMVIEKGYDLGTNANSHFLYLVFGRFLYQIPVWQNGIQTMAFLSLASSALVLYLVFKIGEAWKSPVCGFWAVQILGASFTFWRHACIIEVYNFALVFWAILVLGFLRYTGKRQAEGLWLICFALSFGLLAHIQFILAFPALIFIFWKKKPSVFTPFGLILIPVFVILFSVFVLETNSFSSVFFDGVRNKILSPGWLNVLKGPFFILAISLAINPALLPFFLFFGVRRMKNYKHINPDLFGMALILLCLSIVGFSSLYPEMGIHVFLLPSFLILALVSGFLFSNVNQNWKIPMLYPVVQVGFFFVFQTAYGIYLQEKPNAEMKWKGGPGYYTLPWAKGNARSILEVAESNPTDSIPETLHWNLKIAKTRLGKTD